MPIITVSERDAKDIVSDDHPDFEDECAEQIEDQDRWNTHFSKVVRHIPTGKFYKIFYQQGSTEMQDNGTEFYDNPVKLVEVEKKEVTEFKWVDKV